MADRRKPDPLPTTRRARSAKVGRLAAGQAARYAGTATANLARSPARRQLALDRRHIQTADQMLTVLGTMKGAAMKVGQMLSFLDVGLIPEDVRPHFQTRLAALQSSAPEVPFPRMARVIEEDLGAPLSTLFADFDVRAVGAASIGQVYRARLHDGRWVAVKTQYPNIATAVRADLKNLALLMRLAERVAPGLDSKAISGEIRARVEEELDYVLEAANQRAAHEAFAGHPFVVIPAVIDELSAGHVLVTEFVDGAGFEEMRGLPQPERDRIGEIVYRFYCGSLFRLHRFSGDPHPGNLLRLDDGRIAFLDFGLVKQMDPEHVAFELDCMRAVAERRAQDIHALLAERGVLPEPERVEPDAILAYFDDVAGWFMNDGEVEVTPDLATAAVINATSPQSEYFGKLRHQSLPPEHAFARRAEAAALGLLGQLGATANWHRIACEWIYGDEPQTELGRLEAGFYAPQPSRTKRSIP
jgi:predicted unusual protein kinase regulating ubiquinone biosynthesis (AarF/ABC1/UbiB family)